MFTITAQNLVPNPSFEDTVFCPWAENQMPSQWISYGASPDYLNGCSSALNVPNTPSGFHSANSGVGMIGVYNYVNPSSSGWPDYREFSGVQLLNQLTVGQKYYMSFHLSFARIYPFGWGGIGSDKLGMKFSTISYSENSPPALNNSAHLYTDSIYTDTIKWVRVSGFIIADSAYSYLMLGNFFDEAHTDILYFGTQPIGITSSYYFIDDVCVTSDSLYNENWTKIYKQKLENKLTIYPNPVSDKISINLNDNFAKEISVRIFNITGQQLLVDKFKNQNLIEINVSTIAKGLYMLEIHCDEEVENRKLIIK